MGIEFINGGLMTTVQDGGRIGYQQFGVPVSGVMDRRSFAIANHLVGNDNNEAVLEVTILGPRIQFSESNIIAVTGGNLTPQLDGQPLEMYRAVLVKSGSVLSFGAPKSGCRAFIAFAGGMDIKPTMGSRSTYLKAKIGGYHGRKLEKGDQIAFCAPVTDMPNLSERVVKPDDFSGNEHTVRVILGPQDDAFTKQGIATFLGEVYTVTNQFDRMGCRFEGDSIEHIEDGNIISDGISFGAIQIPSEGKPIIMLADRQTTGGYTKIANVVTADFPKIAQLKAGDHVRFEEIEVTVAQKLYLDELQELRELRQDLDALHLKQISCVEDDIFAVLIAVISEDMQKSANDFRIKSIKEI